MAISTNQQYLQAILGRFNVTESDIEVIMVEHPELNGPLNVTACKQAMYESMSAILPLANVSEGGFSVSWNMDGLKLWYNALCNELKKPSAIQPKVRNRSNMW